MFFRVFSRRRAAAAFSGVLLTVILLCTAVLRAAQPVQTGTKNGIDPAARILYLKKLGYEVDELEAEENKNIEIPQSFNDVYTAYNDLQKRAGFNLAAYKGCSAVLYTYRLKNMQRDDVYAHLIVLKNEIIGGDITALSVQDGFELPLIAKQAAKPAAGAGSSVP